MLERETEAHLYKAFGVVCKASSGMFRVHCCIDGSGAQSLDDR